MNLEIREIRNVWTYAISNNDWVLLVWEKNFNSAKKALEAGSKKLLSILPKETFDFGDGPVPAHKHPWGGGWVADTAKVENSVFVGPNARVYDQARVHGKAKICENARICGHAEIYGFVHIFENAYIHGDVRIFEFAQICGDADVDFGIICGRKYINANGEKCVLVDTESLECIGPFNSPGKASTAMLPGLSYKIRRLNKP